ncbi:MAG: zinc ribbon domain-containing protein [Nitrosopumilus sp.]|nr:zinc ribbon domain-containing protein [Nitrosopumilus sp.]
MNVGDPYRLEHIKSRLEENKVLALSDKTYLNDLLERHIRNVETVTPQPSKIEPTSSSPVNSVSNYCWKCGTENPNLAKFCNNCGSPIEKLNDRPKVTSEKLKQDSQSWIQTRSTTMPKRMGKGKKILIAIGIILVVIVIVGLIEGERFLKIIEKIFADFQQQIGSLLERLSIKSNATHNSH